MCLRNALKLLPTNNEIIFLITGIAFLKNVFSCVKKLYYGYLYSGRKSSTNGDSSNLEDNLDPVESLSDFDIDNSATSSIDQINEAIQQATGGSSDTATATTTTAGSDFSPKALNKNKQNGPYLFDCVWPSKPIGLFELQTLRSSILISIAYVSLCLKDYSNTVKYCNLLLSEEDFLNSKFPISKGNR